MWDMKSSGRCRSTWAAHPRSRRRNQLLQSHHSDPIVQAVHGTVEFMVYEELRSLAQHLGGSPTELRWRNVHQPISALITQVSHGAIQFMVYEELRSLAQHLGGSPAEQAAQQASLAAWRQRREAGSSASRAAGSGASGGADEAEGPWGWRRRRRREDAVSFTEGFSCRSRAHTGWSFVGAAAARRHGER